MPTKRSKRARILEPIRHADRVTRNIVRCTCFAVRKYTPENLYWERLQDNQAAKELTSVMFMENRLHRLGRDQWRLSVDSDVSYEFFAGITYRPLMTIGQVADGCNVEIRTARLWATSGLIGDWIGRGRWLVPKVEYDWFRRADRPVASHRRWAITAE